MNFAEIENAWQSPQNRPTAAQLENEKMNFIADLRRRHRGNRIFLCLVLIPLTYFTAKVVLHVLWLDPALDKVDLSREWGIIPFFALPWIGWFMMVRLHCRHRARNANYERSINASVAALLDENRTERMRFKFIAVLLVASALLFPIIVFQLQAVGKAGNEIVIPALVVYPVYVLLMLVWFFFHHRRKLNPRKRELESLLQSYNEMSGQPKSNASSG
jgi:hypothetical protein